MSEAYVHTFSVMGTVVTIHLVGHEGDWRERLEWDGAVARSVAWFHEINDTCTRFDARSEVRRLSAHVGEAVPVSAMVFEAVQFALAVAEESDGAFDPTVGLLLEARGFTREHRSGGRAPSGLAADDVVSYRDVVLDPDAKTILLQRPLVLDLGAVAKGLAVDMATRELEPFANFAVDAGGDLYLGGHNAEGREWSVGVRHPRNAQETIETLRVSEIAVCTSGDYERPNPGGEVGHHILDPRDRTSATAAASVTVFARSAMVADALATAAFVLGPAAGVELLERHGVDGLILTPELKRFETPGMERFRWRAPVEAEAARDD